MLPSREPLWEIEFEGRRLGVFYPGQGASLASVCLERANAAGVGVIIGCGGAGAVAPNLALGAVIIATAAVRDEGTSYHYLPPSREVAVAPEVVRVLSHTADTAGVPVRVGKAWTTDALFRETPGRVAKRREEGCLVVDSELASLLAVAQFRGIMIGQYFYAGDDLSGDAWEHRRWTEAKEVKERLFTLAARAALQLEGGRQYLGE